MNGLAHITIAGQQVGLKFGLPAIKRLYEKVATLDLVTNFKYNQLGIIHLLYAGYVNYCLMKDCLPEISFEAFYNYVEGAADDLETTKEVAEAIKCFEDSRYIKPKLDQQEQEVDDGKKKVTSSTGTI